MREIHLEQPRRTVTAAPVTVRDIAQAVGVSHSTAAAALRYSPKVRKTTRDKVLCMAKNLGYRRNLAASVLGSKQSRYAETLAIAQVSIVDPHFNRETTHGNQAALEAITRKRGYVLHRFTVGDRHAAEAIGKQMESMGVDGVIIRGEGHIQRVIELPAQWQAFSLVSSQPEYLDHGIDVVEADYFGAFKRILNALQQEGYRRPGVILRHHTPMIEDDYLRLGAILSHQDTACTVAECIPPLKDTFWGGQPPPGAQKHWSERLRNWFNKYRPDVIFGFNRYDYCALQLAGIKIPDDTAYLEQCVMPQQIAQVAGLQSAAYGLGLQLLNLLDRKVRNRERGYTETPLKLNFMPRFFDGGSLPRPIARSVNGLARATLPNGQA